MNQCLSCNKPCVATAVFCESCRTSLLNHQQKRDKSTQAFSSDAQAEYAGIAEQIQIHHRHDITATRSGEEDIQPVHSMGKETTTVPLLASHRHIWPKPLRIVFFTLVVVLVLTFIVDAVLFTFRSVSHDTVKIPSSLRLLVTPNIAHPGQRVLLPLQLTPGAHSTSGAQSKSSVPGAPVTPGAPDVTGTSLSTASSPGEPILHIPEVNLTFTYTQGQGNLGSQEVTLANRGGSAFSWQASVESSASSWLSTDPNTGTVASAQSAQISVSINPAQLTPGTYNTQVLVNAADSSGIQVQNSPQTLSITLIIYPPCAIQVTPSNLAFTVSLLQPNAADQNITLKETGNCARPVSWSAQANRSWLILSNTNGIDNSSIAVHVHALGMLVGTYSAQITLSASDSYKGAVQVTPQAISVTLQVNAT